jgi:aminoglycoside phosphotransferase (APT) family kinase protein
MTASGVQISLILEQLGLPSRDITLTSLPGGVSSDTTAVTLSDGSTLVVKQALARLTVAEEWLADPSRAVAEGHGLAALHALTPQAVPKPIGIVDDPPSAVLPLAPQPSTDWRAQLLTCVTESDMGTAMHLREVLETWHTAPLDAYRGSVLDDTVRVTQLRVDPFYRGMAQRWPDHAAPIAECVAELLDDRTCLVHGDFTPKNVLCHPAGIWVIDTEICHIGNPLLDLGSMAAHLLLKSVKHRHDAPEIMAGIRTGFFDPPMEVARSRSDAALARHTGVILAVRVAGRSPVGYLDAAEQEIVGAMAIALLQGATLPEVEAAWLAP